LGSCSIGAFNEQKVKKVLEISTELGVVSLLTLGHFEKGSVTNNRKLLDKVSYWEKYGRREKSE